MLIYNEDGLGIEVDTPTSPMRVYGYDEIDISGELVTVPNSQALLCKLIHISANAVVGSYQPNPIATYTFNLLSRNNWINPDFLNFIQMVHDYFIIREGGRFDGMLVEDAKVIGAANEAISHLKIIYYMSLPELQNYNGELNSQEYQTVDRINRQVNDRNNQIREIYRNTSSLKVVLGNALNLTPGNYASFQPAVPYQGQSLEDQYQSTSFPPGYEFAQEEAWMSDKELRLVSIINEAPPDMLVFSQGRTQEHIDRLNRTAYTTWEERIRAARSSLKSARKLQEKQVNRHQHQINHGMAQYGQPAYNRQPFQPVQPQMNQAEQVAYQYLTMQCGIPQPTVQMYINAGMAPSFIAHHVSQTGQLPPMQGQMPMMQGMGHAPEPTFGRGSPSMAGFNRVPQNPEGPINNSFNEDRYSRRINQREPQPVAGLQVPDNQRRYIPERMQHSQVQDVTNQPLNFDNVDEVVTTISQLEATDVRVTDKSLPIFDMSDIAKPPSKDKGTEMYPVINYSEDSVQNQTFTGINKAAGTDYRLSFQGRFVQFKEDVKKFVATDIGNIEKVSEYEHMSPGKWTIETSLDTAISNARLLQKSVTNGSDKESLVYRRFAILVDGIPYTPELKDIVESVKKAQTFAILASVLFMSAKEIADSDESSKTKRQKLVYLNDVNRRMTKLVNEFLKYNLELKENITSFQEDIVDLFEYIRDTKSISHNNQFTRFAEQVMGTYIHAVNDQANEAILESLDLEDEFDFSIFHVNTSITLLGLTEAELKFPQDEVFALNDDNAETLSKIFASLKYHSEKMSMPTIQNVLVTEDDSRFIVYAAPSRSQTKYLLKRI